MSERTPEGVYVYQPHPVTRKDGLLWSIGGLPDGLSHEHATEIADTINAILGRPSPKIEAPIVSSLRRCGRYGCGAMTVEEVKDASVHCAYCGAWMGHFGFTGKARCLRCAQKPPETATTPRVDCVENAVNRRCRYRGKGDPPQDCDYPECGCESAVSQSESSEAKPVDSTRRSTR
jgi:hypothetical protein